MQTDCICDQLRFEGFDGRKVIAAFDGGAITSDTGALLLRETDKAIGLFIISWPGKVDIGVSDHLVVQTDLFATLADIIGSPLPDGVAMDGFSFAKDLVGATTQSRSTRRTAVHHSFVGTFAYRSGPWKLILDDQSGGFDGVYPELEMGGVPAPDKSGWRLFNLETDLGETHDVRQENTDVFDRLVEEFELVRRSEGEFVLA